MRDLDWQCGIEWCGKRVLWPVRDRTPRMTSSTEIPLVCLWKEDLKRLWPLLTLELDPGNQRLLTPSSVLGMCFPFAFHTLKPPGHSFETVWMAHAMGPSEGPCRRVFKILVGGCKDLPISTLCTFKSENDYLILNRSWRGLTVKPCLECYTSRRNDS